MHSAITNNTKRNRFETTVDGEFAYLDYELSPGVMALVHTFVPPAQRHQGIAFRIIHFAMEYAKANNLKVIPACPSVELYLEQHPEYAELVAEKES
ncbi:MAG TPA: GNAT family N-acetyltransferase [Candidatus Kapabacteria bacterium]|nr:GNAT family N-acetyltransferase [Candidatus Kapabacteria bacterium]